jgi:sulfoxide reductase heme-binding subunit YedZ
MKAGKHDFAQPILFGAIVGILLLLRVYWSLVQIRNQKHQGSPTPG